MSAQVRASAARVICEVVEGGRALDLPLQQALEKTQPDQRALLQQLSYGTLRGYFRLEAILAQLLKKPLKRKDRELYCLLLCGLHQLLDMRTPDHAAISTSVDACRVLGKNWATGLVNGVLRRATREKETLLANLTRAQESGYPQWWHQELETTWPQQLEKIVRADSEHPPMCLRVNRSKTDRDDYLQQLQGANLEATPCDLSTDGVRLRNPVDVQALPGFSEGLVSVQDEAAQMAALLLKPEPGESILDACAAPGGKTCHMLEVQPELQRLVAMDNDESRLTRIADNLQRLDLHAELLLADARQPDALEAGSFDAILADAPCSGSGVLRRNPDIRLLRRPDDIEGFARLQFDILKGLWPLLKPGGRLLYATCSIFPNENQHVVHRFCEEATDANIEQLHKGSDADLEGMQQYLPTPGDHDGLFYSMLRKGL